MHKTKRYQAMLFDLDGTLLDSKKDIALATNATLAHMGCDPIAEDTIYTFVGKGVRDLIRGALGKGPREREDDALNFFNTYYLAHCADHSKFFRGVTGTLNDLAVRGVKLAVLTNKPQMFTDAILTALGAASQFGRVVSAEAGFPNKPDKTSACDIMASFGVTPDQTLMVGDSIVDLQTAENVGMDCALMLYGFSPREEMLSYKGRAKYIFEEFDELLPLG
jgi:phosphoglycolate phosphatase